MTTARDVFMKLRSEAPQLPLCAEQLVWYGLTYGYAVSLCPQCKGEELCSTCDGEAVISCAECCGNGHYELRFGRGIWARIQCRRCFGAGNWDCGHCDHGQKRCATCDTKRVVLTSAEAA